jgi:hypothetical protein
LSDTFDWMNDDDVRQIAVPTEYLIRYAARADSD